MGWTYKHKKLRDAIRKKYTDETGRADYQSSEFIAWLERRGHLKP